MSWVWWFNNIRLQSSIGYQPPSESEADYYRSITPRQHELPVEPALR